MGSKRTDEKPPPEGLPPEDLLSEQAAIGAMLESAQAVEDVFMRAQVTADDFYTEAHQRIVAAIVTMRDRGDPIDQATVASELGARGQLAGCGGPEYLAKCRGEMQTTAHAVRYGTTVRENAILRRAALVGGDIAREAYDRPEKLQGFFARAETRIATLADEARKLTRSADAAPLDAPLRPPKADAGALLTVLPPSGFVHDYYGWAEPCTDAPRHFHLAAGLVCVSAALGRRCYVPFGPMNTWPNLYAVLIAPSSRFRKSTVQRAVTRLLGHLVLGDAEDSHPPESVLLPQEFSPESFFAALSERPEGLLVWSEFGQALARFGRSYMAGTAEFLTEVFDCPPRLERRLRHDRFVIERPCISIFAATTSEWLTGNISQATAVGGFLPRFVFFAGDEGDRKPFIAMPPALDPEEELRLARQLSDLRTAYADPEAIAIDPAPVAATYTSLATDLDRACAGRRADALRDAFLTRLGPLSLKLGMLFDVAERPGTRALTPENFDRAATVVTYLRAYVETLIADELVFSDYEAWRRRALQAIRDHGPTGIRLRDLQRGPLSGLEKRRRDELIEALQEEGLVVRTRGRKPERGPTPEVLVATEHVGRSAENLSNLAEPVSTSP